MRRIALAALALVLGLAGASSAGAGPKRFELHVRWDVSGIAAEGARVAIDRYIVIGCDAISIWDPVDAYDDWVEPTGFCSASGESDLLALAGRQLLWADSFAANTYADGDVYSGQPGRVPARLYSFETNFDSVGSGTDASGLAGQGPLLVFATSDVRENGTVADSRLLLVEGRHTRLIRRLPEPVSFASVDAGRIAAKLGRGAVWVMDATGRVEAVARPRLRAVENLILQGGTLAIANAARLETFDAATGRPLASWKLPHDARLDDYASGFAALVSGNTVRLLNVWDGSSGIVAAPEGRQVHDVLAQLEPAGLFYAYSSESGSRPGHVVFVPWSELAPDLP